MGGTEFRRKMKNGRIFVPEETQNDLGRDTITLGVRE